jgi:hypothetical protein
VVLAVHTCNSEAGTSFTAEAEEDWSPLHAPDSTTPWLHFTQESRNFIRCFKRHLTPEMLLAIENRTLLRTLLAIHQHPPSCASSRFLLVESPSADSGMGYEFLSYNTIFLQAIMENRVMLFTAGLHGGGEWRWCNEEPHALTCYFRPWSPCQGSISQILSASGQMTSLDTLPAWEIDMSHQYKPIVVFRQTADPTRTNQHHVWVEWEMWRFARGFAPRGRLWWYTALFELIAAPQPKLLAAASQFLRANGVKTPDDLIVAHVRHGGKHVEQAPIPVSSYEGPIAEFVKCLHTKNVLVVTETQQVLDQMSHICSRRGWNCFWTLYKRTTDNVDIWNPSTVADPSSFHISPQTLHTIGWNSLVNLYASRQARAFVGTVQSAWAKFTTSVMTEYHIAPPSMCSLSEGWAAEHFVTGKYAPYLGYCYGLWGEMRNMPKCPSPVP